MNAAETSASSAIALWTELTVVSRSSTTAEIDTFISDVSTTSTNIAAASRSDSRVFPDSFGGTLGVGPPVTSYASAFALIVSSTVRRTSRNGESAATTMSFVSFLPRLVAGLALGTSACASGRVDHPWLARGTQGGPHVDHGG